MTVFSIDEISVILERSSQRRIPLGPRCHGITALGFAGFGRRFLIPGIRQDRGFLHVELFQGGLFHHHFFGGLQPVAVLIGIVRDGALQGPQKGIAGEQDAGFQQFQVKNRFAVFHGCTPQRSKFVTTQVFRLKTEG